MERVEVAIEVVGLRGLLEDAERPGEERENGVRRERICWLRAPGSFARHSGADRSAEGEE